MRQYFVSLAALLALAAPSQAQQQMPCGPYKEVVKSITSAKYGERLIAIGELNGLTRMEVFGSPLGKTYTVLAVNENGTACFVMMGANLKTFPLPLPGSDI